MNRCRLALLTALITAGAAHPALAQRAELSAPVTDVRYTVSFDEASARARTVKVSMSFVTSGAAPVVLSLPAWTPGAYEITYFAKWVTSFAATGDGKPVAWDKVDYDTWRIRTNGAKSVVVSFDYRADTLDNAMAWAKPDFLLFNGTNLFLYPEGASFDRPATVIARAPDAWKIATGMTAVTTAPRTFSAANYHDLVDMPFFVGRFDIDSAMISERWVRFATYPAGSVQGANRALVWDQLKKIIPAEVAVFRDAPWKTYTVMQIADSSYGGGSGLEHQNSHVDVVAWGAIGDPGLGSLYAHEIFHSWNVKRLRPSELWPYQYAQEQPTAWLWMSEGITDYYADLAEVRGGAIDSTQFLEATVGKINQVNDATPVALEDASLSTWIHPVDGTGYLYYPKGSLAGLMLDVMIRDASDNRKSLDDVMRGLYDESYKQGKGFTGEQWWRAVSAAAGGKSFTDFNARFIDGREPYPWATLLPLAGIRVVAEHQPRIGVTTVADSSGVLVTGVADGSTAAKAGVLAGDVLLAVGEIAVTDESFGAKFRASFGEKQGAPLAIKVRRAGRPLTLNGSVELSTSLRLEINGSASAKAARIRAGILHGTTGK
ncbi:MAG: PDZ domain-containing protein [Gemmatimonadaceae bacterium]